MFILKKNKLQFQIYRNSIKNKKSMKHKPNGFKNHIPSIGPRRSKQKQILVLNEKIKEQEAQAKWELKKIFQHPRPHLLAYCARLKV